MEAEQRQVAGEIFVKEEARGISRDGKWGKQVLIHTSAGEMPFIVKEIHVFTSIWGGINIGLTLVDGPLLDAVKAGDKVFKII